MMFKPSVHGWPFANTFDVGGPALGLGAAPGNGFGLGGGMCWSALDRYLDGRSIPETGVPEEGTPLFAELLRRQVAALSGVWDRVRTWQALPDGSWRDQLPLRVPGGGGDAASLSRGGWSAIRRSLDAERPVLLTLVLPGDGYTRGVSARQVLAYAYQREGARVTLSIYDPDRPGDDDHRLVFSLAGGLEARLTRGEQVRGFFPVPYDREPATPLRAETFGDRSVIGLNRKVRGRPSATVRGRTLHLVARDPEGALLHFQRPRGSHWEGANVTEREELGSYELHSDPAAVAVGMGLHVFARSYVGDLLHFRLRRGWSVANRTEHRRAGARFRIEGDPVPFALPRAGLGVVARGRDGALVSYIATPVRGWWADEVQPAGGGGLGHDPVVACVHDQVHVVARGRNGHLLHFLRAGAGWSAGDLTSTVEGVGKVAGTPALIAHQDQIFIFARTPDGDLLRVQRDEDGAWSAEILEAGLQCDPVATRGPAGVHAFAADPQGLLHIWRAGDRWEQEGVSASRADLPSFEPGDRLLAWGDDREIRVLSRGPDGLVEWAWRASTDWVAAPFDGRRGFAGRHAPGQDPVLADLDAPHLFATDAAGTLLHFEPGSGDDAKTPPPAAPAPVMAAAAPTPAMRAALARRSQRDESLPEPEPLPLLDGEENAGTPAEAAADAGQAPAPEPDLAVPNDPEPQHGMDDTGDVEPLPGLDDARDVEPLPGLDDARDVEPLPGLEDAGAVEPLPGLEDARAAEPLPGLDDPADVDPLPLLDDPEEPAPLPLLDDPQDGMREDPEPLPGLDDPDDDDPDDGDIELMDLDTTTDGPPVAAEADEEWTPDLIPSEPESADHADQDVSESGDAAEGDEDAGSAPPSDAEPEDERFPFEPMELDLGDWVEQPQQSGNRRGWPGEA